MKNNGSIWKRLLALMLSITIAAGCFGGMSLPVKAQEDTLSGNELHDTLSGNELSQDDVETVKEVELSVQIDTSEFPEHEELLGIYIDSVLYSDLYGEISTFASVGTERLTSKAEKTIYKELKSQIKAVAAGTQASTMMSLSEAVSFTWTAEDLGITKITADNVQTAVGRKLGSTIDLQKILMYLLMDCPYDFYWYDKTQGLTLGASIDYTAEQAKVSQFVITVPVAPEFRNGDPLVFDTSLAANAKKAKAKAKEIVEESADLNDFGKLVAFKDAICELTSYNTSLKETTEFRNPREVLWVFDGDTSTKVVCEGYTKAFQYLCDLAGLECYTVSGDMDGYAHMWNIVTLYGKNYLVNVTNCDSGTIGAPDKLFLVGTKEGNVHDGYEFSLSKDISYVYSPEEIGLLGEEVLTLSSSKFDITKKLSAVTLKVSSTDYKKIKLTWTKNDCATGYKIYRKNSDGEYVSIKTISSGSTLSYTDTGLSLNKSYSYKIRPIVKTQDDTYKGTYSSVVTGKTKGLSAVTLKAKSTGYNKIKLTWTKNSKATGYKIYRKNSDGNYDLIKTITSNDTLSYTDTGRSFNKTYYYKIAPVIKIDGTNYKGTYSSVVSAKTKLSTPEISDVKSVDYKTLKISWEKISGASGYQIYRATSSSGSYKKVKTITSGSTLSYKDTSVTPNKKYYYKVRAYKTVNGEKVYGSFSDIDSGKSMFTKVKDLKVKATSYKKLKISWSKVSGASKYQIYYSTSKDSGYKKLATVKTNSYTWDEATCGTTYYFKVRAIKTKSGDSIYGSYSSVVSGKTTIGKPTASAAKKNYNSIKVSWDKVSGAQKYQVYWATKKDGDYKKLATTTETSYVHTGRDLEKTYYYKVRAIRQNSKSSFSKVVSAKTSLGKITELKVGRYGDDDFKVSWKAANGATSYKVYRATSKLGTYKLLDTVTKTYYVDKNVSESKVYYYKVVGYRDSYKTATAGPLYATMRVRHGIDVSEYQGSIDWTAVKEDDVEFAMLRIVKGQVNAMKTDARFEEYYKGATKVGLDIGVYRYCYATSVAEVRKEAKEVLRVLNGRKLDYPVVLDMEDDCLLAAGISNSDRSKMVLEFKKIIEDAGYEFAVYANLNWLNNYFDMEQLENVDIWLARWRAYSKGPEYTGKGNLTMWQYSSAGKVDGIDGYVDLDVSY